MRRVGWWPLPLAPRTASILMLMLTPLAWGLPVWGLSVTTSTAAALSNAAKLCASVPPLAVDLGSRPFPKMPATTPTRTATATATAMATTATTTATTATTTATTEMAVVTWLVDGNNLSCSKHAPNDRETILRELRKIASPRCIGNLTGSPTECFDRWTDKGKEEREYNDSSNSNNGSNNNDCDNEIDNQATEVTSGNGNKAAIQKNVENEPERKRKRKRKQKRNAEQAALSTVLVVFDGNEDETRETVAIDPDVCLAWVVTDGTGRRKDRADDWIVRSGIPRLSELLLLGGRDDRNETTTTTTTTTARTTTTTTTTCNRNPRLFHRHHRVHLVSADRDLRKRVRATRVMRGGSEVNPPAFWRDYLPVLQKQQRERRRWQR